MTAQPTRDRLFDLLCDRALCGLTPAEDEELGRLLVDFEDGTVIGRDIEHAATAVALANLGPLAEMPKKLAAMIESDAADHLPTRIHRGSDLAAKISAVLAAAEPAMEPEPATERASSETARPPPSFNTTAPLGKPLSGPLAAPPPVAPPSPPAPITPRPSNATAVMSGPPSPPSFPTMSRAAVPAAPLPLVPPPRRSSRTAVVVAVTGWLAAAACLTLAGAAWYARARTPTVVVATGAPPPGSTPSAVPTAPPPSASPSEERTRLLARSGTQRSDWSRGKDAAGKQASGDVVWNGADQRGYMRIRGLPKNDRRSSTYQLWIFDKDRDDKFPVDGGIFDIDDDATEVVVSIQAKLMVSSAAAFAITIEKPGGVVVSKREHLVLIAKTS